MGSNPTLSLKAKDGFEPSLKDLQSFTLPLCYLALNYMIKKKIFIYNNNMILLNGSFIKIKSIKYFKNYQINFSFKKEKKLINNKNKSNFFKKIFI